MFFKRVKNKKFDHIPRFYNPNDDVTEKRKKKLKFRVDAGIKKKSKIPIMPLLLLAVIIYFFIKLNGA